MGFVNSSELARLDVAGEAEDAWLGRAPRAMAGAYDGDMAGRSGGCEAARTEAYVVVQVVSPQGEKHPLKVRPVDDVATLRALCTQV